MPNMCQSDFLFWISSRMHPLKFKRNTRIPSFSLQKLEACPRSISDQGNVFFFICLVTVSGHSSARYQLCLCVPFAMHMCSPGTRGLTESFHWSCKFLWPSLRSCGTPVLSLTQKNVCLHTVAHHSAMYNPHHFSLALEKWCDRKAGCRQIWQSCQVFQKDKSTEDHHNAPHPSSKRLSYVGTSVLMMYNMEDD